METDSLDGNNVWRDGFVSSFTMILLAEIADKTFFIAAILGRVLIAKCTNVSHPGPGSDPSTGVQGPYRSAVEYPTSHAL